MGHAVFAGRDSCRGVYENGFSYQEDSRGYEKGFSHQRDSGGYEKRFPYQRANEFATLSTARL